MPSIIEGLNWQRIMEAGASGFGSSVAEVVIRGMFPDSNNTERLLSQAVGEICDRVKKIVDQAFINEYVADCNSIASRLAAYPDSRDVTILQSIFNEGSNLIYRLRNFDTFESIVTENYICTLHLMAVKALSEYKDEQHDFSGYKDTLKRLGREYADWCEPRSEQLNDFARASVGNLRSSFLSLGVREGYFIKEISSFSDVPELCFSYMFSDNWHVSDENIWKYYSSETLKLTDRSWYDLQKVVGYKVTLTEKGKSAREFLEAYNKAHTEATQFRNDFLNDRLSITNAMKESILSACKTWRNL
ncbi:hypothetical protein COL68_25870 [Bacillus wiedmannii]|uniref:hypothetical protein n=1 Tax=Bacillus wiedmannii TaxID=1890302 RepID=UPI000BF8875B|nr:hypothetical protein [Bacillus wiedmannii]PFZ52845.1 hypothetical protein COL68_25870 [Bacillus wiedmannii]